MVSTLFFNIIPFYLNAFGPLFFLAGYPFEIKVACLVPKPSLCNNLETNRHEISFHASGTSNFETNNNSWGHVWTIWREIQLLELALTNSRLRNSGLVHRGIIMQKKDTSGYPPPFFFSLIATLNCFMTLA